MVSESFAVVFLCGGMLTSTVPRMINFGMVNIHAHAAGKQSMEYPIQKCLSLRPHSSGQDLTGPEI